jgi:hypothetical protein
MPILAGFAHHDLTPPLPFPLAGMVVKGGRTATRVRDPLFARAAAFSDGDRRVCLASSDLLVHHGAFTAAVEAAIARAGVHFDALLLAATHTHSAPGGYWDAPSAESFMGAFREDLFRSLSEGIAAAAVAAAGDLRPASLSMGVVRAPGLNWNRRHPEGAVDDHLAVLVVDRAAGADGRPSRHRLVSFGAHPVIVSEKDTLTASADFPGEVVRALSQDGDGALWVSGPVGGVSPLWPAQVPDAEAHLAIVRDALLARVRAAEESATPVQGERVVGTVVHRRLRLRTPKLFPARWWPADAVALPLRLWARRFVGRGVGPRPEAPVTVLRLGELVIAGFPADMGADVGLAVRSHAARAGLRLFVAASQSNDFVGYVHLPPTYELPPRRGEDYASLTIYENAMAACGREVGTGLVEQFDEALARLEGQLAR